MYLRGLEPPKVWFLCSRICNFYVYDILKKWCLTVQNIPVPECLGTINGLEALLSVLATAQLF